MDAPRFNRSTPADPLCVIVSRSIPYKNLVLSEVDSVGCCFFFLVLFFLKTGVLGGK